MNYPDLSLFTQSQQEIINHALHRVEPNPALKVSLTEKLKMLAQSAYKLAWEANRLYAEVNGHKAKFVPYQEVSDSQQDFDKEFDGQEIISIRDCSIGSNPFKYVWAQSKVGAINIFKAEFLPDSGQWVSTFIHTAYGSGLPRNITEHKQTKHEGKLYSAFTWEDNCYQYSYNGIGPVCSVLKEEKSSEHVDESL